MRITRTTVMMWIVGAVCLTTSSSAYARGHGTPDGQPPAQEQVCEDAGLVGSAYGLCVAFCEANDCDSQTVDKHSCSVLRDNYYRATGDSLFPCESDETNFK